MNLKLLYKLSVTILITSTFSASFAQNNEVRVVISEGVGRDVAEAAQNAAQNALTTVVGSFIDSSTVLEKRVQIQDGVKTQTKNIKTDVKEYSQGFIQNFEILSTSSDGLIKVTAKVAVRIDDFKIYVKKLAEVEIGVNAGLFAQIKTEEKQALNASGLIYEKILNPLVRGEAVVLLAGPPKPFSQLGESINNKFANFERNNSHLSVVGIVVEVKGVDGFFDNAYKILNSIAVKKTSGVSTQYLGSQHYNYKSQFNYERDVGIFVFERAPGSAVGGQMDGSFYVLPSIRNEFAKKEGWIAPLLDLPVRSDANNALARRMPSQSLQLEFLGDDKVVLQRERIGSTRMIVANLSTVSPEWSLAPYFSTPWSLVGGERKVGMMIRDSSKFLVLVAVDLQALRQAKSVSLKLVN